MTGRPQAGSLHRASVLVDTSALVALANRHDDNHEAAKRIWHTMQVERCQPFTTNVLIIEAHTLFLIRSHHTIARTWLMTQPFPEEWVTERDYTNARTLIITYRDKSFSLADATSFVVMERRRSRWAFSFDEHFTQYGFTRLTP
ncbi:MAG: VapC toxin family PIN domain ribonuclease [Candidatus Methylomirabilota bacterium]|nr:PIN domain-containing protein [Candidatus Methylomirabilis sp.]NJD69809.1 type II toxin-antitoxin system VapC family toxin [candidate division NC10 bacterium]PWB47406.1 MAG: VapC toxin family PIN domain ribonuclease [candidate division NC10 bacterium]